MIIVLALYVHDIVHQLTIPNRQAIRGLTRTCFHLGPLHPLSFEKATQQCDMAQHTTLTQLHH